MRKYFSAMFTFLASIALNVIGMPFIAVIVLMALIIYGNDVFIKNGDYRVDLACLIIGSLVCIITNNVYWGF